MPIMEPSDPRDFGRLSIDSGSRKNSLNECFEDLTLSGSLNNSFNSDNHLSHSPPPATAGFNIKIPIPRKIGVGTDTTKPVFNNPFLEDFLKWPSPPVEQTPGGMFQSSPGAQHFPFNNFKHGSFGGFPGNSTAIASAQHKFGDITGGNLTNSDGVGMINSSFSSGHESSSDTKYTPDSDHSNGNPLACNPQNLFGLPLLSLFSLGAFNMQLQNGGMKAAAPKFVGPLTLEERQEKISKYMEKKKNRRWKSIRYSIRKSLAEKRQRFQGRFVKTKMPFYFGGLNFCPEQTSMKEHSLSD